MQRQVTGVAGRRWQRLSVDVGLLGGSNVVAAALGLLQTMLVARWLGPEQYGVATLIIAYPNLWWGLLDAKAKEAAVRFLGEFHARGDRVGALAICKASYGVDAVCALAACVAVLATLPWVGTFVPVPEATWLMAMYACGSIPFALVGTSRAALGVLGRFDLLAATEVGLTVLRTGLVLTWTFLGGGVAGLVLSTTLGIVLTASSYAALGHVVILRAWGGFWLQGRLGAVRERWGEMARFVVQNSAYVSINTLVSHGDLLVLGAFRSSGEVGMFKLAKTIAGAIDYVRGPTQTVAYTWLLRSWGASDHDGFRERVASLSVRVGIPLGLGCVAVALVGPAFIPFLVGGAYDGAIGITRILLLTAAVQAAFFSIRLAYMVIGRLHPLLVGSAMGSAVLSLTWLAVARDFGPSGIAWATAVVAALQNAGLAYVLFRLLDERAQESRSASTRLGVQPVGPSRDG